MRHFIDIETGPLADEILLTQFDVPVIPEPPPFDPASVAVGNIKDPVKIDEKISAAREKYNRDLAALPETRRLAAEKALTEYRNTAALSAISGRVLLIVMISDDAVSTYFSDDEATLLHQFWDQIDKHGAEDALCGFNVKSFDLPFLVRRSLINHVAVPKWIVEELMKFNSNYILDLRAYWQLGDKQARGSLSAICQAVGIPVKESEVGGHNFYQHWKNNFDECLRYCVQDTKACIELADRMGL